MAEAVEYADPSPIGELIGSKLEDAITLDETIVAVGSADFDYFVSRTEFGAFLNFAVIVGDNRRFRHGATIESPAPR